MATIPEVSIRHHFADLIDPRIERSRLHELLDIVGIALCAVIAGAESWPAVEAYGRAKQRLAGPPLPPDQRHPLA